MFETAGRIVYRGRWTLLVVSLAVAVLVAPFGMELFGRMADGGFDDPSAESTTAAHWSKDWYGGSAPDVVVLYRHPQVKVNDPRFKRAVHASLRSLPAAYVSKLATYWTTGSRELKSRDEHSTYALVTLRGDKQASFAAIKDQLKRVQNLDVSVGGSVPLTKELNDQTAADLARAEAISMPVLLVLLVIVFGSLVAAGLPLVVGAFAVVGALVLLRLLTELTQVSVFSLNVVTMLALGLAVDYSLFVLNAFREEIRRGATTEQAVVHTMATAGRTVAFSGLTVATALLGLLLFPQMFLHSIGLGAAAVVLVAMLSALVVLPAVLSVLGPRVDALRITPDFGFARGTFWHGIASSVMRRPVLYLGIVTLVLVSLAMPFLHVKFGQVDHRVLPAASESRQVAETIDRDFARNSMATIDVHVLIERTFTDKPATPGPFGQGHTPISAVTPITPLDAKPFADRLRRLPGVDGVDLAGFSQANGAVRLAVRYSYDPMSTEAQNLVTLIRSMAKEPNFRQVVVGGSTAAQMDLLASLLRTLPWMALVVGGATFLLLFAAFGSLLLPLKALLMNVLSIGASFGVIVWAFQDGHLATALRFTSTGTIEATVTVLILAVVFGLSMDYELFLLSRIRHEWLRTGDNTAAVARGLQQTGGVITSAALLLLVVIGAFSTAGITIVKLLGVGMFVAIVIDATLVRALLVPATMRLLGPANWWLPPFLRRLHHHLPSHTPSDPNHLLSPTTTPASLTSSRTTSAALASPSTTPAGLAPPPTPVSLASPPAPKPITSARPAPSLAPPPTTPKPVTSTHRPSTASSPGPTTPAPGPTTPTPGPATPAPGLATPTPGPTTPTPGPAAPTPGPAAPTPGPTAPAPGPTTPTPGPTTPAPGPIAPAPGLAAPAPGPAGSPSLGIAHATPPGAGSASSDVGEARRPGTASTWRRKVVKPNPNGPGWHWAEEPETDPANATATESPTTRTPGVTRNGRPAAFGVDTDPVPVSSEVPIPNDQSKRRDPYAPKPPEFGSEAPRQAEARTVTPESDGLTPELGRGAPRENEATRVTPEATEYDRGAPRTSEATRVTPEAAEYGRGAPGTSEATGVSPEAAEGGRGAVNGVVPGEAEGGRGVGEVDGGGDAEVTGWVRVAAGRTRVVKANPDGPGWVWVEVDL
ncbi:MMPL family transporter [Nonomuraea sediminis]|uniref:MMPL family transporter n=1 Tax=Nonomuraea sediminis TaxID=2835864 RepID=UPI001BDD3D7F|nr:MMPL family transporter [Nonomuraea sediminis]